MYVYIESVAVVGMLLPHFAIVHEECFGKWSVVWRSVAPSLGHRIYIYICVCKHKPSLTIQIRYMFDTMHTGFAQGTSVITNKKSLAFYASQYVRRRILGEWTDVSFDIGVLMMTMVEYFKMWMRWVGCTFQIIINKQ